MRSTSIVLGMLTGLVILSAAIDTRLALGGQPTQLQEAAGTTGSQSPPAHARGEGPRVTLSESDITLSRLFDRLTALTGIKHRYEREAEHQHVAVFCKERPLSELHRSIQELLLWHRVERKENGARVYSFVPGRRLFQEAAAGLEREEKQYRRALLEALRLATLDESSPEWRAVQRERPTVAWMLNSPQRRGLLRLLAGLPARDLQQVLAGRELTSSLDRLAPEQQGLALSAFEASGSTQHGPIHRITLRLERSPAGAPDDVDVAFEFAGVSGKTHLYAAPAQGLRAFWEPTETEARRLHKERRARYSADPLLSRAVPPAKEPLDPRRQPREMTNYTFWLMDLHRRTDLPLIADIYPHREPGSERRPAERLSAPQMDGRPLWQVLDNTHTPGAWRIDSGWALLRAPGWFRLRLAEKRFHPAAEQPPVAGRADCCPETGSR